MSMVISSTFVVPRLPIPTSTLRIRNPRKLSRHPQAAVRFAGGTCQTLQTGITSTESQTTSHPPWTLACPRSGLSALVRVLRVCFGQIPEYTVYQSSRSPRCSGGQLDRHDIWEVLHQSSPLRPEHGAVAADTATQSTHAGHGNLPVSVRRGDNSLETHPCHRAFPRAHNETSLEHRIPPLSCASISS